MPMTSPFGHGQIRSFRMPSDFWLRRVERCREQNQPLRAATILRHAMQQEPDSAELCLEYADELRSLNCYEASNRECYALLARRPSCFSAFGLLAQNLLSLGRPGEAMDAYAFYAQYARLFPESLPDWDDELYEVEDTLADLPAPHGRARLRSLLKAAGHRVEAGDLERARALLLRAGRRPFPKKMPQRDALWALYFRGAGRWSRARAHALRAVKGVGSPCALLLPMALLLHQHREPEALPALLLAAIRARTPEDERGVCIVAAEMGREEIALPMLNRTLRRRPNRMSAAFNLCVLKLRAGDLTSAAAPIHRLREIDPDDPSVEKLFATVERLSERNAPSKEVREAGRAQPFYGVPDERVWTGWLRDFYGALQQGVEAFAGRLTEDRGLYRDFLSLLMLDADLYKLLPAICAAMPREEAVSLLRRVLLLGLGDARAVGNVCALLQQSYGLTPPFLVRFGERLSLMDPSAPPPQGVSFMQRMIYRRLRELRALGCGKEELRLALRAVGRLSQDQRKRLAGDLYRVWPMAFRSVLAGDGQAAPADGALLQSKERLKAWLRARRAIKRAL